MAFVKYVSDTAPRPQVRIAGTTITISEDEWNQAGLRGADFVNLFWDAQAHRIGMASTGDDDHNKFSAKLLRRGVSIPARKFFAKFGLTDAQAEGGLSEEGDVVAFKVNLPQEVKTSLAIEPAPPAPKRRGRKPKTAVAA